MRAALTLALLSSVGSARQATLELDTPSARVEVVEGPLLLSAAIAPQWGGHTFSYVLEGERAVFWSARGSEAGPALVGQHPKPGVDGTPRIQSLALEGGLTRIDPPQLVRTPDGYLHAFLGCRRFEGERETGDIRYFRSVRPEEVGAWEERTELLPRGNFARFHNRQNVGISRDGRRLVLVTLTDFVPEKHSMNLPLVWFAEREGKDFRFREPIVYGEATSFFYPQVAATDEGPVLVGAVHREPNRNAELVHLDWDGKVLLWRALPRPEGAVDSWAFELQPANEDWSRLILVRHITPREGTARWLEFWEYDTHSRTLELRRSLENDTVREPAFATAGKLLLVPGQAPLFLNEPGSTACVAWEGNLLGNGTVQARSLPGTKVSELGYSGIRSLYLPSVLQGSVLPSDGQRPLVADVEGAAAQAEDQATLLLWWIRRR